MASIFKTKRGAKAMAVICLCCFNIIVLGNLSTWGQIKLPEKDARKAVFDTAVYYSKIVREPYKKGMNNQHWAITKFNLALKIPATSPYCSTFGIFCFRSNGFFLPGINGMAYSWRKPPLLVWHRGLLAIDKELWPKINLMDAVVCTWSHVEFIGQQSNGTVNYELNGITTIAGNTRGGKNRGEGVYFPIFRPFQLVSGIYNHFTPYYQKKK